LSASGGSDTIAVMKDVARPIRLRGVRVHNLKGIDLDLPTGRLIVFTGVSGSGKSSLAFDTLYAEGQRRYIETFSAYTRQFLERLDKPDADRIDNIPPAIAVGQRQARWSARSTVATVTEIHEHLGILFARAGRVVCRNCGTPVDPADPGRVAARVDDLPEGTTYLITFPVEVGPETDLPGLFESFRSAGFARVRIDGRVVRIDKVGGATPSGGSFEVVVDRLSRGKESSARRLDSIETAFAKGLGRCKVVIDGGETLTFYRGRRCPNCGLDAPDPDPRLFRYNSPLGACPTCEGFGRVIDLDLARIVADPSRSIREGAIIPWTTPAYLNNAEELLAIAPGLGIPVDVPFERLTPGQVGLIVEGAPSVGFQGLRCFFHRLEAKQYKMHVRVFLSRWRGYSPCPACGGTRLRPEARSIRLGARDITEVVEMTVDGALAFLDDLPERDNPVARLAIGPARARLEYLRRIGLGYLTLDRPSRTLSAGEARRVALTSALGSGLVNTLYVLDEPSIGLHPRDIGRLIDVVGRLRDDGNTVVVVEHDEDVMRAADWLVDIGPGAGEGGGRVVYEGPPAGVADVAESATGEFLSGRRRVAVPDRRRDAAGSITLNGASGHNLKGNDVVFPLGVFCVVTGVSGAGKSTLVEETLYPLLKRNLKHEPLPALPATGLSMINAPDDVILVDQSPIGRTPRSNPVTYLKAFDEIRKTFAATHEAKARKYGASKFSFNVEGGRCSTCEGNGQLVVDMQFLADVTMRCPDCLGKRYRPEVLEVTYRGKSIADVLDLTAREAFSFFRHRPKVQSRLRPLLDVGLEYLRLGQPASTLSGGEAQRLKLASFLATTPGAMARAAGGPKTLFLFDEPTTGLHPADVLKLIEAFDSLLVLGHSLLIIEHNPDLMVRADWIIDLGPEAGDGGGRVVAEGTPEDVARSGTATGQALASLLAR
jgi:excinuclease ABC subunit A